MDVPKKLFLSCIAAIIALTACNDQPSQNDLPTVNGDQPQAVAVNPPRVWIDSPLADTALVFDGVPLPIIAHASFLSGNAILRVADASGTTLETVALEQTEQARAGSGLLTRHEGEWLPQPQNAANVAPDGSVIYRLTVELGGLASEPVILRLYQATPTPSPSPTLTATPTNTPSPTHTPTLTASPTSTVSSTPSASATATASPSVTPSPSASATWTPTATATATITATATVTQEGTDTPEIVFVDKIPGPCEFTPIRGMEVAARVGPGESRAARLFLPNGEVYTATGYNDDLGAIWWLATINNEALWVDSNQVIETGMCGDLVYVTAPPVVYRPPDETEPANDVTVVPGQPVIHYFTATPLNSDFCATLSWSVEFVDAVYLNGEGVIGMDSRQVCLPIGTVAQTRTYTLVIYKNGVAVDQRTVTIGSGSLPPPPAPVGNHAPAISSVTLSSASCLYNDVVTMMVYFSDPDGNAVSISNAFTNYPAIVAPIPGTGSVLGNRATQRFRCIGDVSRTVTLTLSLSDGYVSTNGSINLSVIGNPH